MPHKPYVILAAESLSTGLPIDLDGPMVDDFTGEPIQRLWPDAKPKQLAMPLELDQQRHREKSETNQLILQAAGIVLKPPKPQPPQPTIPKGRTTRLVAVIHKPWRRI
jgi:hypothetical protein